MSVTVLLCGDPQQPSEYMYEALGHLEERGVRFERMEWIGEASPAAFRDETMSMEADGPASYDTGELADRLEGVDTLVVHKAPVPARVLDGADRLELVAAARGGTENVDAAACRERGIEVVHAPGRNRHAVADYAVALLLARLRGVPSNHGALSEGEWAQVFDPDRLPPDLRSTEIGVVGFGNVGRGVVRRLRGFDATVLVHDPYVDDAAIEEAGAVPLGMDELLGRADAVTLHVRLSAETEGLLDAAAFERMKRSAVLVNTARGGLVDEPALVGALDEGAIAGAALDVFREEPLPADHPLLDCEGVVLTPHVAGSTRDAVLEGPRIVGEDLARWLDGEPLANTVD
jgi:D-3-phosphoglycerate dehydrogenase